MALQSQLLAASGGIPDASGLVAADNGKGLSVRCECDSGNRPRVPISFDGSFASLDFPDFHLPSSTTGQQLIVALCKHQRTNGVARFELPGFVRRCQFENSNLAIIAPGSQQLSVVANRHPPDRSGMRFDRGDDARRNKAPEQEPATARAVYVVRRDQAER